MMNMMRTGSGSKMPAPILLLVPTAPTCVRTCFCKLAPMVFEVTSTLTFGYMSRTILPEQRYIRLY